MLDDYKDTTLTSTREKFKEAKDIPLMDMRAKGVDPQSLQDALKGLEYPADYAYICTLYHAVNNNAALTRRLLNIYNTRLYRALDWERDPEHFEHGGKGGAPKMLQEHHIIFIEAMTILNPRQSCKELARILVEKHNDLEHCSEKTVRNARKSLKFNYEPPKFAPAMKEVSKQKRVNWCIFHIENNTNFENVVFSDESWFELGPDNSWVWRRPGDYSPSVCAKHEKFPKKVMVWGAIGSAFKSKLIFWQGNVNQKNYFQTLKDNKVFEDANERFGENEWLFQQDNARPHVAKASLQEFKNAGIRLLEDWPPYSPDLNIIEVVWAIMKHRIDDHPKASLDQLKEIIQKVWDELSFATINKLVASMPKRMHRVVYKKGETVFLNEL